MTIRKIVSRSIEDGVVSQDDLALTYTSTNITGDGSTTAFTIESGHTVNSILVVYNGVVQKPTTDYTVSGTTLTFGTAPTSGAEIVVRYFAV